MWELIAVLIRLTRVHFHSYNTHNIQHRHHKVHTQQEKDRSEKMRKYTVEVKDPKIKQMNDENLAKIDKENLDEQKHFKQNVFTLPELLMNNCRLSCKDTYYWFG